MQRLILLVLCCSVAIAQNPYRSYNNFNAGELSPLLSAREDLAKYQSGCSIMENLIPIPQGGAQKRPGTKFIAEVKTSSLATRILPFEFSTSQSYIIEVGNQYMRFFTNGLPIYFNEGTEDLSDFDSATGDSSLIAHWKLDDNLGTQVILDATIAGTHDADTTTNFTEDLSRADLARNVNAALDMNDTDYITLADHADFTFVSGGNDTAFSLAVWVYYIADGGDQGIIGKFDIATDEEWRLLVNDRDFIEFEIYDASANDNATAIAKTVLKENEWHFIVATYDATGGSSAADGMIIYVDGEAISTTNATDAGYVDMEDKSGALNIGSYNDGSGGNDWVGYLDNVAVFSKELSASEIAGLISTSSQTPYEIDTPYLTADLFRLKYEQSADVLYITHPDYETRKLSRLANDLWTLTVMGVETGPFRTQNFDETDFIAANGITGSVILTATGHAPFQLGSTVGHAPSGALDTSKSQTGALFKLVHPFGTTVIDPQTLTDNYGNSQVKNTSWMDLGTLYEGAEWSVVTTGTWTGTFEIQRNYTIGAADNASGWEKVLQFKSVDDKNVTTTGTEDIADASYRAILVASGDASEACKVAFSTDQYEHIGIVKITSVSTAKVATATVIKTLASTDATHKWSEGAWSNYRGWPQTVTFFEDRLTFGGNTSQPDTIWTSVTSDYQNMTAGPDDDEALIFTLSSRQVNVIEWIIGKDKLLIGTSGAEWTIAGGTDEPLTPANAIAKQHSTYGSANLQAQIANESILFFQRGAEKMRELAYNWELDSYVAPDMTILSNLVTRGGIVETAFQKTPDSILWCIRTDGELPVFSYERKENITAWSRMVTTDGTADSDFESIARISGSPEDEVWVVVERTINSSTVRYIEQFQPRDFGSDADDAYYVDAGITYDSTPTTTITGLTHLEGETVAVLADGVILASEVVASGQITIDASASTVQVGLPYEVHLRTMPLSWVAQGITIQGRQKRISEVISNWYVSGDFSVGRDASTLQTVSIDGQTTAMDRTTFPPGFSREGYVYVYQSSPEPLTLLALMVEFDVN